MVELKFPFEESNPSIFWVADFFTSGKRLPFSEERWRPLLKELVASCWLVAPDSRPSASGAVLILNKAMGQMKRSTSGLSISNASSLGLDIDVEKEGI